MKEKSICDWESNASLDKDKLNCKDKPKPESAFSSAKLKWTQEEDNILDEITKTMKKPIKKWMGVEKEMAKIYLVKQISLRRTAKQCRERYLNHIEYKRKEWTSDEEQHMFKLNKEMGNRWKEIANKLGRKDNDVKNQYYACYRKKFRKLRKEIKHTLKKLKMKISSHEFAKRLQNEVAYLDLSAESMIEIINKVNDTTIEIPEEKVQASNSDAIKNLAPKIAVHKHLLFQTCRSAHAPSVQKLEIKEAPEKIAVKQPSSYNPKLSLLNVQKLSHIENKGDISLDRLRRLDEMYLSNEIYKLYFLASFQVSYNLFFQGD